MTKEDLSLLDPEEAMRIVLVNRGGTQEEADQIVNFTPGSLDALPKDKAPAIVLAHELIAAGLLPEHPGEGRIKLETAYKKIKDEDLATQMCLEFSVINILHTRPSEDKTVINIFEKVEALLANAGLNLEAIVAKQIFIRNTFTKPKITIGGFHRSPADQGDHRYLGMVARDIPRPKPASSIHILRPKK